jgi:ADP-ribose pyrophosphatase YjhB (NUDIX family)
VVNQAPGVCNASVLRTQRNWIEGALRIRRAETPRRRIWSAGGGLLKTVAAWRELQSEVAIDANVSVII